MWLIFLVAGTVCPVMAVVAMAAARMPADELAHPLAGGEEPADAPAPAESSGPGQPGPNQRGVT